MCQEGYNIPHSHGNTHPRTHKITFCIRAEGMEYCVTQIVCRFSCFLLQAPSRPPNFSSSVRWTALPLHHVVFGGFFHQRTDFLTEWTEIKTLYMVGFLCTHTYTPCAYTCMHTHTHTRTHTQMNTYTFKVHHNNQPSSLNAVFFTVTFIILFWIFLPLFLSFYWFLFLADLVHKLISILVLDSRRFLLAGTCIQYTLPSQPCIQ